MRQGDFKPEPLGRCIEFIRDNLEASYIYILGSVRGEGPQMQRDGFLHVLVLPEKKPGLDTGL